MEFWHLLAITTLVAVFLNSSGGKAFSLQRFAHWLDDRLGIGRPSAVALATSVVVVEAALAVLMTWPPTSQTGVAGTIAVLTVFTGFAWANRRHLHGCPCFGPTLSEPNVLVLSGRNLALIALAVTTILVPSSSSLAIAQVLVGASLALLYWMVPGILRVRARRHIAALVSSAQRRPVNGPMASA